jgi:uncharacterized protein YbjT (DUF2867 family)
LNDDRMPTLQGNYKVPHLDSKAEADDDFRKLPSTLLLTSFYFDNLILFDMGPKRDADGKLAFTFPTGDAKVPSIAAEDIGKCSYGIFKRGSELIGKTVGIAGEHLTGAEMAKAMSQAIGEQVRHSAVPPEVFRTFGFPGAEDLGNMFQFFRDFSDHWCEVRNIEFSRSLNPELQTFRFWLKEKIARVPIEPRKATA